MLKCIVTRGGGTSIKDRYGGVSYTFGSENFVKTYIFGSGFLPVQVYILGSHQVENYIFG